MLESVIFKDRSKLSPRYIPTELPHREGEIKKIRDVFKESYIDPEEFPLSIMQLIGPAGLGKTSSVLKASKLITEDFSNHGHSLNVAYVNLKLQGGNKYGIYRFLLEKFAPDLPSQGLSAEEMLRYLLHHLHQKKRYGLIILDEIDYLIKTTRDTGIIYDLTRLNEFEPGTPCDVKGVIFIARSKEFHGKLDQAEISTLGRFPMEFFPYTLKQVTDILVRRCSEAFNGMVIGSDMIDEIAEMTIMPHNNSDIRFALDLLLYSGNLAEAQGTNRITLDQIREVYGKIRPSITPEDFDDLSMNQTYTLLALVRTLRMKKKPYAELKEIRLSSFELMQEYKLKKLDIEDHLHDLHTRNIIEVKSLRDIGIPSQSLEELESIIQRKVKLARH
jgi:archaeal cell division control protein 6